MIILAKLSRRLSEWFLAANSVLFGWWILSESEAMGTRAYEAMLALMGEAHWGMLFVLSGLAQCVALWINGGQGWTPYVRAVSHLSAAFGFYLGAWGFYHIVPSSTAVYLWGAFGAAYFLASLSAVVQIERQRIARHG